MTDVGCGVHTLAVEADLQVVMVTLVVDSPMPKEMGAHHPDVEVLAALYAVSTHACHVPGRCNSWHPPS